MPTPPGSSYGFRRCCEAVREAVSIEEIARRYTGLEPYGGKASFIGRCPLPDHEDRTPSFYIYPPGRWRCYGCGRGGDVIDLEFLCGGHGELWEAMVSLAVEHNVELPRRPEKWYAKQERQRPVREQIRAARVEVLRRRLFRYTVLPLIKATTPDGGEYREEVTRAWEDFRGVPVEGLLDCYDHLGGA